MAAGYSWSDARDRGTYRLPGPEHLGWWAAVAMLLSILLHVAVFFALDHLKIALRFEQARELSTGNINVRQIEVRPLEDASPLTPDDTIIPTNDTASLLEDIDLLDALPENLDVDLSPEILQAEYALKMQSAAAQGAPEAEAAEILNTYEIESALPDLGRQPQDIIPAAVGQLTVDPGAAIETADNLENLTDDLLQKGIEGGAQTSALEGIASLDSLLDLPPNLLVGKKTLLPSDLLFEFNSAELRESAKVGLMKLALLIDRNPDMHCWIEGHTDLVGGDDFNLKLSIRRAQAVKSYLTDSLLMDASKIHTRGFGRYHPIVTEGDTDAQAINRRVEIRMRKTPPAEDQLKVTPQKAPVVPEETPPKAILVKPRRALPLDAEPLEENLTPVPDEQPLIQAPSDIQELPEIPKARPVDPQTPLRALPVDP
ncbi:MAG: OmpA family protein [Verrucomicrobiales bacterium]|nr:OmpA family protein [Verrucomicrobiota bacterium JB025]